MRTQTQTPNFVNLRTNPRFAAVIAGAVATAKSQGAKIDTKANHFKAATATRDYAGLERAALRIMKMRGLKYTDENFQAAIAAIAAGKLTDQERFRAAIAFESDATSIHVATRGIDEVQAVTPLFLLVEIGDATVQYDTGAWKKNERFTRLGNKLRIVAGAAATVVSQYLN